MLKVSIVPGRVRYWEVWFPSFISFLNLEKKEKNEFKSKV